MYRRLLCASVVALLVTSALVHGADEKKDELQAKDRKLIAGTWQVVSLQVNGKASELSDTKKISVINGNDGSWSLRVDGQEVAGGTSTFDPTQKPKAIDFIATRGDAAQQQHLGIYELGDKRRKMCFAPPGKPRPEKFNSTAENEQILVEFERVTDK